MVPQIVAAGGRIILSGAGRTAATGVGRSAATRTAGSGLLNQLATNENAGKLMEEINKSIEASAKVETMEVSLRSLLGSRSAARDRVEEYSDIAKETPLDFKESAKIGNRLQALGQYSKENVILISDLATASSQSIDKVMDAYSKLVSGNKSEAIKMFKDLSISTEDWVKALGTGMSKTGELKANTSEMAAEFSKVMKNKGYAGASAAYTETTAGVAERLSESKERLRSTVGERIAPASKWFNSIKTSLYDTVAGWIGKSKIDKIREDKAEVHNLLSSLQDKNITKYERAILAKNIQQKFPEIAAKLDLNRASSSDIQKLLSETNANYDKQIKKSVYQQKLKDLQKDVQDSEDDYMDARRGLQARANVKTLMRTAQKLLGKLPGVIVNPEELIAELKSTANWHAKNDPNKKAQLLKIATEIQGQVDLYNTFGGDERKMKKGIATYEAKMREIETVNKGLSTFFPNSANKAKSNQKFSVIPSNSTMGKNVNQKTLVSKELEKASTVISGGGGTVKNFNIRINSLIGANTNMFNSSTDDPRTASTFMQRLSDALQSVVNDVNYSAS